MRKDPFGRNTKRNRESTGRGWHSSSYHKYFEGYKEYETVNEKGKTVIRRVYEGTLYCPELTKKQRTRLKIAVPVLWLLAVGIFIFAATRYVKMNASWYGAILELGVLGCMIWELTAVINYLMSREKLTVNDFRSGSRRLLKSSFVVMGALILTSLVYIVCSFIYHEELGAHFLCAVYCWVATLPQLLLNRLESNVTYSEEKPEKKTPDDVDAVTIE